MSQSVMHGFLAAVSINILAGQVPELLGVKSSGSFDVAKAIDAFVRLFDPNLAAVGCGVTTVLLLLVLDRSPYRQLAAVAATVVPTGVHLTGGLLGRAGG